MMRSRIESGLDLAGYRLRVVGGPTRLAEALAEESPACLMIDLEAGDGAIAVIEGGDERTRGEVTLKDLALGAELAKSVESRAEWVANREAQKSVRRADLVAEIKAMLKGRA